MVVAVVVAVVAVAVFFRIRMPISSTVASIAGVVAVAAVAAVSFRVAVTTSHQSMLNNTY